MNGENYELGRGRLAWEKLHDVFRALDKTIDTSISAVSKHENLTDAAGVNKAIDLFFEHDRLPGTNASMGEDAVLYLEGSSTIICEKLGQLVRMLFLRARQFSIWCTTGVMTITLPQLLLQILRLSSQRFSRLFIRPYDTQCWLNAHHQQWLDNIHMHTYVDNIDTWSKMTKKLKLFFLLSRFDWIFAGSIFVLNHSCWSIRHSQFNQNFISSFRLNLSLHNG